MKTKIEIIQRLLDEQKITAVEAMTLMQTEKEYVYIPQWNDFIIPYYPPYNPYPYYSTSGGITITSN